jgi:CBS domain-containing membrane protein
LQQLASVMPLTNEPEDGGGKRRRFWQYKPLLAGATLRERLVGCLGAILGISLTALVGRVTMGEASVLPWIVAPMGASAVLLFVVPSSPMAQPWSIVGGNTLSALTGIGVSMVLGHGPLAAGVAVGLAIAVMSLTRCVHPPGGAAALTAVIGGPVIAAAGFSFALVPVALNSVLLAALGFVFHRFSSHDWPHKPKPVLVNNLPVAELPPALRAGFLPEDVDAVLADEGEAFDISRHDLARILHKIELRARMRARGGLTCVEIMTDAIAVARQADSIEATHAIMRQNNIHEMPVTDARGRLVGVIGLTAVGRSSSKVAAVMETAVTASPHTPVFELLPRLMGGRTQLVAIISDDQRLLGVVTPGNIIAALTRTPGL